jgi:hypothetical protein
VVLARLLSTHLDKTTTHRLHDILGESGQRADGLRQKHSERAGGAFERERGDRARAHSDCRWVALQSSVPCERWLRQDTQQAVLQAVRGLHALVTVPPPTWPPAVGLRVSCVWSCAAPLLLLPASRCLCNTNSLRLPPGSVGFIVAVRARQTADDPVFLCPLFLGRPRVLNNRQVVNCEGSERLVHTDTDCCGLICPARRPGQHNSPPGQHNYNAGQMRRRQRQLQCLFPGVA